MVKGGLSVAAAFSRTVGVGVVASLNQRRSALRLWASPLPPSAKSA